MNRPEIGQFESPADYLAAMIQYRKIQDRQFSVHKATKTLRKISPALVSLVMQKKRKLTLDRVDAFAKLLDLNPTEKVYFRNWVGRLEEKDFLEDRPAEVRERKDVGLGLLSDWLNVYIKDFFQIEAVQKDPTLLEKLLLPVATPKRVAKCVAFLLREGYLRKTLDGRVVVETQLAVAEPPQPHRKIRQFHKGALDLAKLALDLYSVQDRLANTLVIPLDEPTRAELRALIAEFAEQLKDFAARKNAGGDRLYQLVINLSPVGGSLK